MLRSIFRYNEKVFMRASVGKSEGNTAQQMLVKGLLRFAHQFSLRFEKSCVYPMGLFSKRYP